MDSLNPDGTTYVNPDTGLTDSETIQQTAATVEATATEVHTILDAIEKGVNTIDTITDYVGPVIGTFIPASRPIVAAVEMLETMAENAIDALQGEEVDSAALAAQSIAMPKDNEALHHRILQLEHFIASVEPLLKWAGKEFGFH